MAATETIPLPRPTKPEPYVISSTAEFKQKPRTRKEYNDHILALGKSDVVVKNVTRVVYTQMPLGRLKQKNRDLAKNYGMGPKKFEQHMKKLKASFAKPGATLKSLRKK